MFQSRDILQPSSSRGHGTKKCRLQFSFSPSSALIRASTRPHDHHAPAPVLWMSSGRKRVNFGNYLIDSSWPESNIAHRQCQPARQPRRHPMCPTMTKQQNQSPSALGQSLAVATGRVTQRRIHWRLQRATGRSSDQLHPVPAAGRTVSTALHPALPTHQHPPIEPTTRPTDRPTRVHTRRTTCLLPGDEGLVIGRGLSVTGRGDQALPSHQH